MTITILVIAALLLLAFWLLFMAVARDNRVVTREPSEFELACRRFNESMQEMQAAFATALTPAFTKATSAMTRFHEALTRAEQNQDTKPHESSD